MPAAPDRSALTSRPVLLAGAGAVAALAAGAALSAAGPSTAVAVFALLGLVSAAVLVRGMPVTPAHVLCAGVALSMLSGNWGLLGFPFGVDRLVVLAGVAATLVAASRDPEVRLVARPVHLALAATSAWAICSAVLAGTLSSSVAVYSLMDRFGVVPFLAFFAAPYAFRTLAARVALIRTLVVMGAYLGLTAVFEEVGPTALVYPRFIMDPAVGLHFDRARGPFLEASANGLALVMCAVVCALAVRQFRGRWRQAAVAAGALCLVGVALTLTRSAWIAVVLGGAAALTYAPHLRRYLLPAAGGLVAVVLALLLMVPGFAGSAQQRAEDQSPVWDRQNLVTASARIIDDHPLFGLGWSRYPTDSPEYFRQADSYPLQGEGLVVHNVPLLYLTELGILGFAVWVLGAAVALVGPLRRRLPAPMADWQAAHLAILVAWATVAQFAPLAQSMPNLLVFLWAGVTAGCVPWMSPFSARPGGARPARAPRGTPADVRPATPVPS